MFLIVFLVFENFCLFKVTLVCDYSNKFVRITLKTCVDLQKWVTGKCLDVIFKGTLNEEKKLYAEIHEYPLFLIFWYQKRF